MSSIILEKTRRCENGTRWNNKTKKCEPKTSKKYTFKRGEGTGQVKKVRGLQNENQKRCENGTHWNKKTKKCEPKTSKKTTVKIIEEDIFSLKPMDIDVNTPNPLFDSFNNTQPMTETITSIKPLNVDENEPNTLIEKIKDTTSNIYSELTDIKPLKLDEKEITEVTPSINISESIQMDKTEGQEEIDNLF